MAKNTDRPIVDYQIGRRVFRWQMPGVLRRIELAQMITEQGSNLAAGACWVAGLHPDHIEQCGLDGLPLAALAEAWPDHMAATMAEHWDLGAYMSAYADTARRVSARFVAELSAGAVDAAEKNSQATHQPEAGSVADEQEGQAAAAP